MSKESIEYGCWLLTFPFWIYVDENFPPFDIVKFKYNGRMCRIYKPFRSAAANFNGMPVPNPERVPSLKFYNNDSKESFVRLSSITTIPRLDKDSQGNAQLTVAYKTNWESRPNPFPMDSLRIDLENSYDNSVAKDELKQLVNKLLTWTRITTSQWWIDRTVLTDYIRSVVGINQKGEANTGTIGQSSGHTVHGDEKALSKKLWQSIINNVKNKKDWSQHDIFLLDAQYYLSIGDLKSTILNATFALEMYIDFTFERLWNKENQKSFKRGRLIKGNDLTNHITRDLRKFINASYEDVHGSKLDEIVNLWHYRGQVAHGKKEIFKKNSRIEQIKRDDIKRCIKTVNHCISWLSKL